MMGTPCACSRNVFENRCTCPGYSTPAWFRPLCVSPPSAAICVALRPVVVGGGSSGGAR